MHSDAVPHAVLPINDVADGTTRRIALTFWAYGTSTRTSDTCKGSADTDVKLPTPASVPISALGKPKQCLPPKYLVTDQPLMAEVSCTGLTGGDHNMGDNEDMDISPILPADEKTIFISIVCYRDSELQHTIRDLLEKAACPDRCVIGVVWQGDRLMQDKHCFSHFPFDLNSPSDLSFSHDDSSVQAHRYPRKQLRFLECSASEARGPMWARALGYSLYRGEDYVLQIDCHMRFRRSWDKLVVCTLIHCLSLW